MQMCPSQNLRSWALNYRRRCRKATGEWSGGNAFPPRPLPSGSQSFAGNLQIDRFLYQVFLEIMRYEIPFLFVLPSYALTA